MRMAMVDDLREDSDVIHALLTACAQTEDSVDVYDSGKRFLDSKVKYDLVFLDIVM